MAKLRVEDFKRDEDGWYRCGLHSISLYRLGGEYAATVHALEDGYGPHGAKIRSWQEVGGRPGGFRSRDEALQWGVDMLNGFPLQRACAALEVAFAAMSEWMPLVLPALANARAEAALAEREACAARLEESASTLARLAAEHLELSAMRVLYRHQSDVLLAESALLRDRTTPATLSSDTLAAIAEARGLCVVEPEHLAELQAAAKTLSEMPVLLWTRDGSTETATVAGLTLLASNLDWRVEVTKTGKLIDAGVIMADGIVAARFWAARCASEVLGVTLPAEVITARDGDGGVL